MELEAIKKNEELWGEDLWNVFEDHINEDGWLTAQWSDIIDNEVPEWDKDYNDNPLYKETYSRMYNLDFEESKDGLFIRPEVSEKAKLLKPNREYVVGEVINHRNLGRGAIIEVLDGEFKSERVKVSFAGETTKLMLTAQMEKLLF